MTKKKSKSDENDNNEIINFYELKKVKKFTKTGINPNYEKHGIKVPFRALLIGSSGVGKTNLLLNIINKMAGTFNHIYIYTKATEPLYDYLTSQLSTDLLTIAYDLDSLRKFDDDDYYGQSLVIFDDMVNEKNQQVISELYIRGRKIKGGISLLYLTQSYFQVPKIIRIQCQYIFILKTGSNRDLKLILSEFSLNTSPQQLIKIYNYCCNSGEFGSFMLIDLVATQNKTFRKNFKEYLNLSDFP